jgi:histone arginine demethylase JMJD6
VQQPGEIIFVPSMWHHAVLNVADSVAVTQNFVDRSGLDETYKTMKEEDERKLRVKLTRCRPDLL